MTMSRDLQSDHKPRKDYFAIFSNTISEWAGKPVTFVLAVAGIGLWALLGPVLDYSESWQLVVNTATTIVTFLMIFVLQNSQNRDAKALQVKLDELILTNTRAENCFIGAEALGEAELLRLRTMLDAKLEAAENARSPEKREEIEDRLEETVRSAKIA